METRFRDRREAGRKLAAELGRFRDRIDVTVLGLPRGGVPVAAEVARSLGAPLDVFLVRKLGVPWHPELAVGAIASGGVRVVNEEVARATGLSQADIDAIAEAEQREIERREKLFREGRPPAPLADRVVIVVDDGLATGATMRAAVAALRKKHPSRLVVAAPVASAYAYAEVAAMADEIVCLVTPEPFWAVGLWYEDFGQTTDAEVQRILREQWPREGAEAR
jgi:putative phosphoribosyl transferase